MLVLNYRETQGNQNPKLISTVRIAYPLNKTISIFVFSTLVARSPFSATPYKLRRCRSAVKQIRSRMALHISSPTLLTVPSSRQRSFASLSHTPTAFRSKFGVLKNVVYRHVERRGLCVVNVGANAGMPNDGKKMTFENLKERVREVWDRCPQPVKMFPWNRVADNFIQLILDLILAVVKYLSVPLFVVTSVSELSYCAHERKLFFTPIPFVIGFFIAGVLKETLLDLSPLLREAEVPWHLIAIAAVFALIKLPGPYYPYWGRICIPHMANGALLRALWLAFQWYRKPRKPSGTVHRTISTDVSSS